MIKTLPELALESAEPLLEVLQSRPVASTPDETEDLLFLVRQGRELLARCWERTLANLRTAMSPQQSRQLLEVMVKLANVKVRSISLTIDVIGETDPSRQAEAKAALREAEEIEAAARETLEFHSRPPAPIDREAIARAREAWERGEGLEAEAMLARRKARRPT